MFNMKKLFISLVLLCGCGKDSEKNENGAYVADKFGDTYSISIYGANECNFRYVEVDGHEYIMMYGVHNGLSHSPKCSCHHLGKR